MEKDIVKLNSDVKTIDSVEVAKMVCKRHADLMRDIREIIRRNPEVNDYFIKSTYQGKRRAEKCYLVTEKGCELLINKYKLRAQAGSLETRFIDGLEEVLKPLKIKGKRQYSINIDNKHYRIDYYIPNLNIAIEYDENEHRGYTYEQHDGRQAEIEKELGCRFIRVSDRDSDLYNIGLVMKELFNIEV